MKKNNVTYTTLQNRVIEIVEEALENIYDEYVINECIDELKGIAAELDDEADAYWAMFDLITTIGSYADDIQDIDADALTTREDKFGAAVYAKNEQNTIIEECIEALA